MRHHLPTIAAIAVTITVSAFTPAAKADDFDKKTNITVNETILIPGRTLPPGKYVIKLLNATANRHVVQIYNEDQTKLQATILAFNNYRLEPTSNTVLQYWETPAGAPPALRAWFFPGDNFGQEFAYPRKMADSLALTNKAKIPSYDVEGDVKPDQLAQLQVHDTPDQAPDLGSTPATTTRAPLATTLDRNVDHSNDTVAAAAPLNPEVIPPSTTNSSANTTLLAQNTPPSPAPAATPNQNSRNLSNDTQSATASTNTATELPQTASYMPWILLFGVVSLLSAAALRVTRKA